MNNQFIMKKTLIMLLATVLAMPVMADDIDGGVPGDTARVYDIDEIVVISQPKEHTVLRQQPLSSTMLSSTELEGLSLHDLKEISERNHDQKNQISPERSGLALKPEGRFHYSSSS